MTCKLTFIGILWGFFSVLSALFCSAAYCLPYWIKGITLNTSVYFGIFRRCNYLVKGEDGMTYMQYSCGRYTTFNDIPSTAWRVCTVLIGLACSLLLLVCFTTIVLCCAKDIFTRTTGKIAGAIQFLAAFLLSISMAAYPSGWGHAEVKQACGNESGSYKLGHCTFGLAFYAMVLGTVLAVVCVGLSSKVGDPPSPSQSHLVNNITVSYSV